MSSAGLIDSGLDAFSSLATLFRLDFARFTDDILRAHIRFHRFYFLGVVNFGFVNDIDGLLSVKCSLTLLFLTSLCCSFLWHGSSRQMFACWFRLPE